MATKKAPAKASGSKSVSVGKNTVSKAGATRDSVLNFRGKTFTLRGGKYYDSKGQLVGKEGTAAIKAGIKAGTASTGTTNTPSKASAIINRGVDKTTMNPPAGAAAGAPPVHIPTDEEWLAGDSAYADQVASTQRSLADTLADSQKQRRDYDTSYNDDLRQLGWNGQGWNTADPLTQSGKAFSGQTNDFAARGMLQSTGYGDAITNTTRQFNQQVSDAAQARTQYDSGLDSLDAANQAQTQDSITQAKRAAIARKSAQYAVAASGVLS